MGFLYLLLGKSYFLSSTTNLVAPSPLLPSIVESSTFTKLLACHWLGAPSGPSNVSPFNFVIEALPRSTQ
jgi:hypothetical protein